MSFISFILFYDDRFVDLLFVFFINYMCNLSRRSPCLVAGDNPARGRGLYAYGLIRVIHDLLICCAPGEGRAGQGSLHCLPR